MAFLAKPQTRKKFVAYHRLHNADATPSSLSNYCRAVGKELQGKIVIKFYVIKE